MKLLLTLLLLLPTIVFTSSAQDEEKIYPVLDVEPSFLGGIDSMNAFLARTIVYPKEALDEGIERKTYVSFTVEVDGTITNPVVQRGVAGCPECDAEAIRVVTLMPKWIPGQYNSKNVKSQYTLPVKFTPLADLEVIIGAGKVEESPQFPGGTMALKRFLSENIMYPQRAIEEGLSGQCYVEFMVAKDGTITNPKIMLGVPDCPECDQEAIRVIKRMPKWTPGKISGKAVNSMYNLPVSFTFRNKNDQ